MTETELKLRDAATQMKLALAAKGDYDVVRSCVNAFISHARSVTFVMQRESSFSKELTAWYEERMGKMKDLPLLRFFNDRRVYSIHKGVVVLTPRTTEILSLTLNGITYKQPGGTATLLRFEGVQEFIPGDSGGVYRLCEQYFLLIKMLVTDWLAKREELNASTGNGTT